MKKQVTIYIQPYIYKVLRRDYGLEDSFIIRKRFHIYMHRDTRHPAKSMLEDDNLKAIKMEGPDLNHRKAYAIIKNIESQFRDKMNVYVLGATKAGYPARTAVRDFLELYDITDGEIKIDSCYKDWQRFEKEHKKRNRIPLWI